VHSKKQRGQTKAYGRNVRSLSYLFPRNASENFTKYIGEGHGKEFSDSWANKAKQQGEKL
jgi:hypothetical protein